MYASEEEDEGYGVVSARAPRDLHFIGDVEPDDESDDPDSTPESAHKGLKRGHAYGFSQRSGGLGSLEASEAADTRRASKTAKGQSQRSRMLAKMGMGR